MLALETTVMILGIACQAAILLAGAWALWDVIVNCRAWLKREIGGLRGEDLAGQRCQHAAGRPLRGREAALRLQHRDCLSMTYRY